MGDHCCPPLRFLALRRVGPVVRTGVGTEAGALAWASAAAERELMKIPRMATWAAARASVAVAACVAAREGAPEAAAPNVGGLWPDGVVGCGPGVAPLLATALPEGEGRQYGRGAWCERELRRRVGAWGRWASWGAMAESVASQAATSSSNEVTRGCGRPSMGSPCHGAHCAWRAAHEAMRSGRRGPCTSGQSSFKRLTAASGRWHPGRTAAAASQ